MARLRADKHGADSRDPNAGNTLPDCTAELLGRLASSGLLVRKADKLDLPIGEELRALEAESEEWLAQLSAPLGLAEAVAEDRSGW